ncbi:MAG: ABC transporter permease subunit [Acidobacteria bacterium]|nr:ABC transporter permease subunit [Acidobacteriota bacterium]
MVLPQIALHVFKESVRDRVPYTLVLFAILLMASSYLLGQLTAGQEVKIIKDLGLAAISIIGLFIAIFIGIGLVSKEVERRSIYNLLSKPVSRRQVVMGKYLGLALTLFVNVGVMAVALYGVLAYFSYAAEPVVKAAWEAPALDPALLMAIGLIFVELAVITAVALLFSTFSSPLLSAALTFGLFLVGHFNADLRHFDQIVSSKTAVYVARTLYYLLPNLALFDVKAEVVHGYAVSASAIAWALGYAVAYISVLVMAAAFIFERRDLK